MSDEELDQYIGRLDWVSNRIYCEGAAGIAARRLRHQQRMIDINEIINTVEEVHLCGSTDNPNPGPPPTGDQAAHPGPSTRGDCERKSAEIIKGLTPDPDPARWEEVAWQDREASSSDAEKPSTRNKNRLLRNLKPRNGLYLRWLPRHSKPFAARLLQTGLRSRLRTSRRLKRAKTRPSAVTETCLAFSAFTMMSEPLKNKQSLITC